MLPMRAFRSLTFVALVGAPHIAAAQEDYTVIKEGTVMTPVLRASDGKLYGPGGAGLARMTSLDGSYETVAPVVMFWGPIEASDGYLYGNDQVTIWRVALTGDYTVFAEFRNSFLEGLITGSVVEGGDGNLYGMARTVSDFVTARIFRVTPAGVMTTVHAFPAADGTGLSSHLMKARDGNLYGNLAGGNGHGTIFRLTMDGGVSTVHAFTGGGGGSRPSAPLVEARDGTFYGTTAHGGLGHGTIFKLRPDGEFSVLHAFSGTFVDGTQPLTALIEGGDGNVYGTTENTIFSMTPSGVLRVLHRVDTFMEVARYGRGIPHLIEWDDGNFYGAAGAGFFFRLNRQRSSCANEIDLELQVNPGNSILYYEQAFKTESPAISGAWFVTQFSVHQLWHGVASPVTPTDVYAGALQPFPTGIGLVGFFSYIWTSDARLCVAWETIDTGGSGPASEGLLLKLVSAGALLVSPK